MRLFLLAAALIPISACAAITSAGVIERPTQNWREVVTSADRDRLRDWRQAWIKGLQQAAAAGYSAQVAQEGALLQPDAAIGGGKIPNGHYRCRTIKLGAKSEGMLPFVAYQPFSCRIRQERDVQGFAKLSGSQRQLGLIFPQDQLRQVFLGTLVLGDEARAMQYGTDPDRDLAGFVERIGPGRWRLVLPYPRFESLVDVLEITPA